MRTGYIINHNDYLLKYVDEDYGISLQIPVYLVLKSGIDLTSGTKVDIDGGNQVSYHKFSFHKKKSFTINGDDNYLSEAWLLKGGDLKKLNLPRRSDVLLPGVYAINFHNKVKDTYEISVLYVTPDGYEGKVNLDDYFNESDRNLYRINNRT